MNSLPRLIQLVEADPTHAWAMATLVEVKGSGYRRPGARLLISPAGQAHGVLSGGCLEEEIARKGADLLSSGKPAELLRFDTRLLYGCDGRLQILVECLPPWNAEDNLLARVAGHLRQRRPCQIQTRYSGTVGLGSTLVPFARPDLGEPGIFMDRVFPAIRLLIFGAGPELKPVREFAERLGWLTFSYQQISELPGDLAPDAHTAALVMNHHLGRDLATLARILPLYLPYVGLMGPKKRRSEIFQHLQDCQEFTPDWLHEIHAPAGLDLGAENPEEIALSIVSEVMAVMGGRSGGLLQNRVQAIHDRASEMAA